MTPFSVRDLKERLEDAGARARAAVRFGLESGAVWELRPGGVRVAADVALGRLARSPATLYRFHARNAPDKPALVWHDGAATFAEVDATMDRAAAALARRGVRRGQGVAMLLRNRPELVVLHGAAGRVGAPASCISWRSTAPELRYLLQHSGARALVFEHDLWPVVEEATHGLPALARRDLVCVGGAPPHGTTAWEALLDEGRGAPPADDPDAADEAAVVIFTSGTTGKPKGAVRKFPKNALTSFLRFLAETPLRCDDVHLAVCPLYHSTGFGFLGLANVLGNTVVVDEFKPERFLELVARHRASTTALVPTMLHRLLALGDDALAAADARSLRVVFTGGAPLPGPLGLAFMDRFGDVLYNFYGATETGFVTLAGPGHLRAAPTTIGPAIPGTRMRLLDDAGRDVPEGAVGELWVKNDFLVAGYHGDEQATRASTRDGYFSVGDLARRETVDGVTRYFIEGRKRDMIISGGVNVYPAEVEGALEQHPAVAEVAVVGVPDAEWGERVVAYVALRAALPAPTGEDLVAWCKARLSGAKVPRAVEILEHLPRNPTGKVLKRELRERGRPASGR